jgi:hypothetical protein
MILNMRDPLNVTHHLRGGAYPLATLRASLAAVRAYQTDLHEKER